MTTTLSLAPFVNEPLTDFSVASKAQAFRQALARVRASLGKTHPNVIGGKRYDLPAKIRSTNPARPDELIGAFPASGPAEADRAIAAAEAAFPAWAETSFEERARLLVEVARILRDDKHVYSAWMVLECGKSWGEADADTAEAIDFCEYYARQALRYAAGVEVVPTEDENRCYYVPLGVGVVIAPWNFPLAILCGMTVAALVTGNTVVMKPAAESPTIAWMLFQALEQAGLPPGVANFVTGDGSKVGARLVQHPRTRFISFTGSKEVGLWITEEAAKRAEGQPWIKRVVTEMGGKDAILVDRTADLEAAAKGIVAAAFGYQGQKCSACSRAVVEAPVYDEVLRRVVALAREIRMGDPEEPATPFGPVISEKARKKTLEYLEIARQEGTIVLGGKAPDRPGWFVEPTIVKDVPPGGRVAQEEIFAPVLAFVRAKDFEDLLRIGNGTEFGLTGSLYSRDEGHLEEAVRRFHVGNLYLNRKCTGALVGAQPFGGFNMSGTCSKAGGPDYLGLFLQQKSVARRRA
jgi:1-pyrroline-5-carboxylate dehydrogenase